MQKIKLNLTPGKVAPVCYASQGDVGLAIRFLLFDGETALTLSGTEVITLAIKKADGSELEESVTNTGSNYVDVITTADTCDTPGASLCELRFQDGGDDLGTGNFIMEVEADAYAGANIEERTASGTIANFETNLQDNLTACKCSINPVQNLNGYTKPWSGGAGKNKLNYDAWKTSSIVNGTAVWENNGVKLTATSNDCYTSAPNGYPSGAIIPISEGETITLSWEESTNQDGSIYIFPNNTTTGMVRGYNQQVKKLSYTATSGITYITFRFGVSNSGTTIAYKNIQIEKGSTATAYEPYSNICPISGFSALNVTLADGDMQTVDTATVNFGQEVYGGVVDVTNGKLTITHKLVTYSGDASENWQFINPSYYIASPTDCRKSQTVKANQYNGVAPTYYNVMVNGNIALSTVLNNLLVRNDSISSVADLKTALSNNPLQVLFELATPTEITLTPKQIEAIVGINNVYHDCNGETEVKYLVEV